MVQVMKQRLRQSTPKVCTKEASMIQMPFVSHLSAGQFLDVQNDQHAVGSAGDFFSWTDSAGPFDVAYDYT